MSSVLIAVCPLAIGKRIPELKLWPDVVDRSTFPGDCSCTRKSGHFCEQNLTEVLNNWIADVHFIQYLAAVDVGFQSAFIACRGVKRKKKGRVVAKEINEDSAHEILRSVIYKISTLTATTCQH